MKIPIDKIKRIRKQYGFPIWIIKKALEYYNGDEDAAIKRLIEIYCIIGDHPDIVVKKNIDELEVLIIDDKRSMNNEYNIDITAETKRI